MTLLEEIQNEAVNSSSDLGALLRKCKVLAARLNSKPLEDWLLWESNGYPEDIDVPDYRIWSLELKGHFSGPFGSGLRNAPIPWVSLPPGAKEFQDYHCRQSIASIEQTVKDNEVYTLVVPTGDLNVVLGMNVYKGQNCLQAWAEFGKGNLIELLNTVRNRILDFSLAIWKEQPNAGAPNSTVDTEIAQDKVEQIFNTTVFGGAVNVISSSHDFQVTINIEANNIESLENFLREKGIQDQDIHELSDALKKDTPPTSKNQFGSHVSKWMGNMVKKASDGTWNIGIGIAGNLLAEAISKYYGF